MIISVMKMVMPPAIHSAGALSKPYRPPPLSDLLLNPSVCNWELSFCASDDDDKLPVKLAGIALQSPPLTSEAHSKVLPWGEPLNKCEKPKTFPTNPLLVFCIGCAIFILFQMCYMNL